MSEPLSESRRGGAARPSTVLVADDDGGYRAALSRALQDEGYTVIEAADGDQVLALLGSEAELPDMLLLDFCMPGFSGLGVLRLLKKRGRVPPTFIVTSFPDSSVDRIAGQFGAARVLHKPVDLDALCAAVRAALPAACADRGC